MARTVQERIKISAETKQAELAAQTLATTWERGFERISRSIEQTVGKGFRFGQMLQTLDAAASLASRAMAQMGRTISAIDAAAAQATGIARLNRALAGVEGGASAASAAIEDLASQQQALTRFGDDVTRSIAAQFATAMGDATLSVEQLTAATQLAQDIMEATGKSAQEAGTIVAKAYSGNTEAVSELIPALRLQMQELARSGDVAEMTAAAVGALERAYGGAARAIDPVDQTMSELRNTLGDLTEAFGDQLGAALQSSGALDSILEILVDMIDLMPRLTPLFELGAGALTLMADAAGVLVNVMGGLGAAVSEVVDAFRPYMELREREAALDQQLRDRAAAMASASGESDALLRIRAEIANAEAAIEQDRAALAGLGFSRSEVEERRMREFGIAARERLIPDLRRREARLARDAEQAAIASGGAFGAGLEITAPIDVYGGRPPGGGRAAGGGDAEANLAAALANASSALDAAAAAANQAALAKKSGGPPGTSGTVSKERRGELEGILRGAVFGGFPGDTVDAAMESVADGAESEMSRILDMADGMGNQLVDLLTAAGVDAGKGFVQQFGNGMQVLRGAAQAAMGFASGDPTSVFGGLMMGLTGFLGLLGMGGGMSPIRIPERERASAVLSSGPAQSDRGGSSVHNEIHIGQMWDGPTTRRQVAGMVQTAHVLGEVDLRRLVSQ